MAFENIDIVGIKKILFNRYPFLLIDRVIEIIPGKSAKAYKNLTANEWFFPVHFPEDPMMPGMVQMEALMQTLSVAILTIPGNEEKVVRGIGSDKIRLKKKVTPGNRMDIEAEIVSIEGNLVVGQATGSINGEVVCSGEFSLKVVS